MFVKSLVLSRSEDGIFRPPDHAFFFTSALTLRTLNQKMKEMSFLVY